MEDGLKTARGRFRILHFASHGILDGMIRFAHLLLKQSVANGTGLVDQPGDRDLDILKNAMGFLLNSFSLI